MKINLIAVGTKMPRWVLEAYQEYEKRLPKQMTPKLIEINPAHRAKNSNEAKNKEEEGRAILAAIPEADHAIALEVKGGAWSTQQLTQHIDQWQMNGKNLSFIIGGPFGLSQKVLKRADSLWSLSNLTLPHPVVRVVYIEQLYRAWSLLNNHPYHK